MRLLVGGMIMWLVLASGCSSSIPPDVDPGFSLLSGLKVTRIEPSEYTTSATVNMTLVCKSKYAGSAVFTIVGHGAGGDVGVLQEPEVVRIGDYSTRLALAEGQTEIPLVLLMTTTLDEVGLSFGVALDSLLVGDSMVAWNSPERCAVFIDDAGEGVGFLSNMALEHIYLKQASQNE